MPLIMIAAGPTGSAGMRTLTLRFMLLAGGVAAALLLALGAAVGYWASIPAMQAQGAAAAAADTAATDAAQPGARSALPFAVEQLGALSGRLFKLESQAGQLSEHIRSMTGIAPKSDAAAPAKKADKASRGGPMLPPRQPHDAMADIDEMNARLAELEQQIEQVAGAATLQHLALQRLPTRLPLDLVDLTSSFGNREDPVTGRRAFHAGLDFAAAPGTPIRAAAAGSVGFAGFHPAYGWMLEIEHGNGLTTRYAHASRLHVKAGALVRAGETIAAVGSSGRSTGPHLHFEVLRHGEATDPRRYLAGL